MKRDTSCSYSFIVLYPDQGHGGSRGIPGTLGVSQEYSLDGTPVHLRASRAHTLGQFSIEYTYWHVFGRREEARKHGNWKNVRNTIQTVTRAQDKTLELWSSNAALWAVLSQIFLCETSHYLIKIIK